MTRRFLLPALCAAALTAPLAAQAPRTVLVGLPVSDSLTSRDPVRRTGGAPYHTWLLQGRRGDRLTVDLVSADIDAYFLVRGPDGFTLGSDDDSGGELNARLHLILAREGTYRIIATAMGDSARGRYTLTVSRWETPPAAAPGRSAAIALGETRTGVLEPGDDLSSDGPYQDRWTFDGRPGARLRIELLSDDVDPYLTVLGPDGAHIGSNDDGRFGHRHSLVSFRASVAGRYTILASSFRDELRVGAYRLSLLEDTGGADVPERPVLRPPASPQAVQGSALRITVLYDNTVAEDRFLAGWGFAALIEYRGHTLLMDGGLNPYILRRNMDSLGIAPSRIEAIVLSHAHGDHSYGLRALVDRRVRPRLYLLGAFPKADTDRDRLGDKFTLEEAAPGQELIPGVFTTGEMTAGQGFYGRTPEQSLVITTDSGLVIITGCAHPGVVFIVRRATEMFGGPVRLVMGGFHLVDKSAAEIGQVVTDFRTLGVRRVGATHCTGAPAIAQFAEAYGGDYVRLGAGRVLVMN